ncbi:MAG: metal-dependent transcriptional regulator [Defluviitaleaceae bacterium]|nr:metal-dependent transcriptional regulator [Defluviitaleaceae bacterium]MCL2262361.1 metal-dependent transcriptional regulator [Defluviitaleaceae bacterium]
MEIRASAEDYLETILVLTEQQGKVRSVDIANHMNFSKPTISIQMKRFLENGYITFDENRNIHLTEKGSEIAERIHKRHTLLTSVLIAIGVDEEQAREDACKIEHSISEKTFECIKEFYDKNFNKNA